MIKRLLLKNLGWSRPYQYDRHGNIVLHDFKAIYFFIPKVACSSIKLAIADLIDVPSPDPGNKLAFPHKRNYPFVKRTEILDLYSDYFRFAFVRNPWDRALSCYQNKIVGVREEKFGERVLPEFMKYDSKKFALDMTFEEFVRVLMDIPDITADPHYRSQYTFLEDKNGNSLVNFIGRFESLPDDFMVIKSKINAPEFNLPHVMKSSREKAYRSYYNSETSRLIKKRYLKDVEKFEYFF